MFVWDLLDVHSRFSVWKKLHNFTLSKQPLIKRDKVPPNNALLYNFSLNFVSIINMFGKHFRADHLIYRGFFLLVQLIIFLSYIINQTIDFRTFCTCGYIIIWSREWMNLFLFLFRFNEQIKAWVNYTNLLYILGADPQVRRGGGGGCLV